MSRESFKHYIRTLTAHRRACFVLLVFFVLFSFSEKLFNYIPLSSYALTALTSIVPIIITLTTYIIIMKPNIAKFFRINKINFSDALLWFFLGICANCTLTVINIPVSKLWTNITTLPQIVTPPQSFGEYIFGVLCIAVAPAIFEEIFCRGIVLREYERYGGLFATVASALAFLILHNSITNAISMFLLGLMLAFATLCTRSIFPAMIFHFAVNFFSLTVGYITNSVIAPHLQPEVALILNLIFIFLTLVFVLTTINVLNKGVKKIGSIAYATRPKFGFSYSLIVIILIYILTQIMYFI